MKLGVQVVRFDWPGSPQNMGTKLAEPMNNPQPLSKPHPQILIGGSGEKKTLRLVAQYGDACNFFTHLGPEGLRHKLDVPRVG